MWKAAGAKYGLEVCIGGLPSLGHLAFEGEYAREMATYFTIELMIKGFLGYRQFKPSFAHTSRDVQKYGAAVEDVFQRMACMDPNKLLTTRPAHTGFHRITPE